LYLSRLSHETLRINGREIGAGSYAVGVDDVVEVGSIKYVVVALEP
jgi:ribosomal protein S4